MLIQKAQPASVKLIPSDNGTRYKCVYDAPGKDPTRRYCQGLPQRRHA